MVAEGDFSFPNEHQFVQLVLSILSQFVRVTKVPVPTNPPPESLVWLVLRHETMAILSLKLDHFLMLQMPLLVVVAGAINTPNEPEFI
jgi:hypothetical protein